jgi:hypothetical protein
VLAAFSRQRLYGLRVMTDGTNPVNFEDGTECPASPNKPGELQSAGPAVSLGGDDLVMRLMYELHAHVPEEQRPLSMSDLSDEQAARARKAVHAVLTEWESAKADLAKAQAALAAPPANPVIVERVALAEAIERQRKALVGLKKLSFAKFDAGQATAFSSLWGATGDVQRAAQAALEAMPDEWQDIETAPHACHFLAAYFYEEGGEWCSQIVMRPLTGPFTHWRPMPEPPALAKVSGVSPANKSPAGSRGPAGAVAAADHGGAGQGSGVGES